MPKYVILRSTRMLAAGALVLFLGTGVAHAQAAPKMELPDSLVKKAKVTEAAARKTALAKVKGSVRAVELENEKGHLQYSYDIKVAGQKGITEVNVDALTGTVLGTEHEDEATEAKEAAKEKAPAKMNAPTKPKS